MKSEQKLKAETAPLSKSAQSMKTELKFGSVEWIEANWNDPIVREITIEQQLRRRKRLKNEVKE